MYFGFVYFAIILNFLTLGTVVNDENPGELCFVVLLFRHGDRAPISAYPTDPYSDVSFWPNGWGQLTKLGKLQMYELGKWLRNRYLDYLPSRYNVYDIYVRSTDIDRTLASAHCALAGLYECLNEKENDGFAWQPIPIHTVPVEMDSVLAGHKKCPQYDLILQKAMKSDEVSLIEECYEEVFCNLSAHSGWSIESVRDCKSLYSILHIQNMYGFQLPDWTKNYFPQPLQEMAEFAFKVPCFTTPLKRLKCGPLLKDIIRHMEDKITGKITQKMWMYSAHDSTVTNLMQCLDIFDGVIPPYAATIVLELFKVDQDKYCITISYKTRTTFRVLKLPCCDRKCPFQTFKKIVTPVLPNNWKNECNSMNAVECQKDE